MTANHCVNRFERWHSPLVKHRVFVPDDHTHNARISDVLYNQRSMTETVKFLVKRSCGSAVRAEWYREFREIV